MTIFLSKMQLPIVVHQAALSKAASELWKCCRSTKGGNQFYSGMRTGEEIWRGVCLPGL